MESKKENKQMNITKQNRLTDIENKLMAARREREVWRGEMSYGIQRHKLPCIKKISHKHTLYSTRDTADIL